MNTSTDMHPPQVVIDSLLLGPKQPIKSKFPEMDVLSNFDEILATVEDEDSFGKK